MEASDAGWLQDVFKGSPKHDKSAKHVKPKSSASAKPAPSSKPHNVKLAALGPASIALPALKPPAPMCEPSKFRIVLDVGHTAQSEGAMSARNVAEFTFNLRLAQRIEEELKAEGFAEPDSLLEKWEFDGKKSHFSDRFSGYSVFVSHENPDFKTSLVFAELVGKEMKAQGLQYAQQYTLPIMGHYRHPLLNKETGVYRYDELIVLRTTRMPAVLLEAGSIINRDEELKMNSPERQEAISSSVTAAVKEFCDPRWGILGPL